MRNLSTYIKNLFKNIIMEFLKSLKSRKLVLVIIGLVIVYFNPDASVGITSLIGLYCGSNVAQKFSAVHFETKKVIEVAKNLNESISE